MPDIVWQGIAVAARHEEVARSGPRGRGEEDRCGERALADGNMSEEAADCEPENFGFAVKRRLHVPLMW